MPMHRKLSTAVALTAVAMLPACAQSGAEPANKAAIEEIVREYILENPEIIEDALVQLSEKRQAEQAQEKSAAIASNSAALYDDSRDYFVGPADAEITVVEFFDYRCGFCKRSVDWIAALPDEYDGKVRVVFKELPIFGGVSETAALAALAAGKQDKYIEMHMALMDVKSNDDLTEDKIDELAESIGLDVKKMRADMRSTDVQKMLSDHKALGRSLGVGGTPAFFIADTMIEGADEGKINQTLRDLL